MFSYPHRCRYDQAEIGRRTDDVMCPVCKREAEIERLKHAGTPSGRGKEKE
jgi:hypothetical protein